jgi:hypothetical protein
VEIWDRGWRLEAMFVLLGVRTVLTSRTNTVMVHHLSDGNCTRTAPIWSADFIQGPCRTRQMMPAILRLECAPA